MNDDLVGPWPQPEGPDEIPTPHQRLRRAAAIAGGVVTAVVAAAILWHTWGPDRYAGAGYAPTPTVDQSAAPSVQTAGPLVIAPPASPSSSPFLRKPDLPVRVASPPGGQGRSIPSTPSPTVAPTPWPTPVLPPPPSGGPTPTPTPQPTPTPTPQPTSTPTPRPTPTPTPRPTPTPAPTPPHTPGPTPCPIPAPHC